MGSDMDNLTIENASTKTTYQGKTGYYYQRMSVVANNNGKAAFNGYNWTGVTYHAGTSKIPSALTFNLVITMKAKNWKKLYAARPYLIYKYHGIVYTVYDNGKSADKYSSPYSWGTVYSTAFNYELDFFGIDDPTPQEAMIDNYLRTRIFAHDSDYGIDTATDWWKCFWFDTFDEFLDDDEYGSVYEDIFPSS